MKKSDMALLFPTLFLVGIGIVMVYSASSALALDKYNSDTHFLSRQAAFSLAGLAILFICRRFPLEKLKAMTYPLLGISLGLLIGVLIPGFGVSAGGARRWLDFGSFTLQPAEFARFAIVVYLAYSLSKKENRITEYSIGFVPHALMLGMISLPVFLQPDFGTGSIICLTTWIIMFMAGVRLKHLVFSLIPLLPLGILFIWNAQYRINRLVSFLDPWEYASKEGYQTIHSLMAFGSGGVWGEGIGKGFQKLFYLPEPHTDFIFSVIGEELGLFGVLIIILCYGAILWKGIGIARRSEENFEKLLAAGFTVSIGLQVCINMGVALALLPTKGLTLPFLSYGGSSLLMNMATLGFLMNIGVRLDENTP